MLDNQRVAASAYRITALRLELPAADTEMISAELDDNIWVRMSRRELRDLELFRLSVEKQTEIRLPLAQNEHRARAIWREQIDELLFQADHTN